MKRTARNVSSYHLRCVEGGTAVEEHVSSSIATVHSRARSDVVQLNVARSSFTDDMFVDHLYRPHVSFATFAE